MEVTGTVKTKVTMETYILPQCAECGQPSSKHLCEGCRSGYIPSRPVVYGGIRDYTHPKRICRFLWAIEKRIQGLREAFERRR